MTADLDLERVREAHPDAPEPSAEKLASLRSAMLEAIDTTTTKQPRMHRRRPPPSPTWRRALIGATAIGLVGVAAVLALVLAGPSGPSPRQATAAEARAVLRGAAAGLVVPRGAVLHVNDAGAETFSDRPGWTRWREQLWQDTSYPYDQRIIEHNTFSFTRPFSQEWAIVDNVMQLYDPRRNTIYTNQPPAYSIRSAAQPGHYLLTPTHVRHPPTITITAAQLRALRDGRDTIILEGSRQVSVVPYRAVLHQSVLVGIRNTARALVRSGHAQVLYDVNFDGHRAIEISGPGPIAAIRRVIYYVAPRTYQPIGLIERFAGKSGQTVTTRFTTYRLLPGTAANRALVTLPGAHPHAEIDTSQADYNAASDRLFP